MNIRVRNYTHQDLIYVRTAFEELHDFVVSIDPMKRIRKTPRYMGIFFDKFLLNVKNNQGLIYIAEDTEKPIGFIAGFVADKQTDENLQEVIPSQLGIISDLYIEPSHRGKGIGKKLIKRMSTYFKEKNCDAIWIDTNSFNTNAIKLYKSTGFIEREIGLIKSI